MAVARRTPRPFRLLLVQQAADDRITRQALEAASAPHRLEVVSRDELPTRGGDSGTPDLLVLDLDMSAPSARQLLAALKRDPALRHVPLLVLAASSTDADILECYRLNANCCLHKAADPAAQARQLSAAMRFWLSGAVMLPGRPAGTGW
jgi:CheY-like chemotaxis protein